MKGSGGGGKESGKILPLSLLFFDGRFRIATHEIKWGEQIPLSPFHRTVEEKNEAGGFGKRRAYQNKTSVVPLCKSSSTYSHIFLDSFLQEMGFFLHQKYKTLSPGF